MSEQSWPTVCATGHRRLPKGCSQDWVVAQLARVAAKLVAEHDTRTAISGMALCVDQLWAHAALEVGLWLHAAVPYPSQACDPVAPATQAWTLAQQQNWQRLVAAATEVTHVSERDPVDFRERVRMLHARNTWMIERSDAVVAVWDPRNTRSGTANALRTAAKAHKPIIWVNPVAQIVTVPTPHVWASRLHLALT